MPSRKEPVTIEAKLRELFKRLYKIERTALTRIGFSTSAPADTDLENSELRIWYNDTPGSTKVNFKAKDSAGTVVTGSITLT